MRMLWNVHCYAASKVLRFLFNQPEDVTDSPDRILTMSPNVYQVSCKLNEVVSNNIKIIWNECNDNKRSSSSGIPYIWNPTPSFQLFNTPISPNDDVPIKFSLQVRTLHSLLTSSPGFFLLRLRPLPNMTGYQSQELTKIMNGHLCRKFSFNYSEVDLNKNWRLNLFNHQI